MIRNTGHNIYSDVGSSGRAALLMISNYFLNKW